MSMLSKLLAMPRAELKSRLQAVDTSAVKGRGLRRRFEKIRNKEGGFTLLELLVVVAILAAIAGTATIMLQDTDRKGAAAAHVAMMDELSKGIQTYRVLNSGKYPNVWDSLLNASGSALSAVLSDDLKDNLEVGKLGAIAAPEVGHYENTVNPSSPLDGSDPDDVWVVDSPAVANDDSEVIALRQVGITHVRYLDDAAAPENVATGGCLDTNLKETIKNKGNDVTAQNIYRPPAANGCGATANTVLVQGGPVVRWAGAPERVGWAIGTNVPEPYPIVAFGIGPDSTLFDPSKIGSLSNVPVYRHVESDEYNRFIVLFNTLNGEASFQAIIDGAGDTKDEELGEVDNVRTTL